MTSIRLRKAILPLGLAGVIAAASLAGGAAVVAKPKPDQTAAKAQAALSKGQVEKAISLAEAVVAAAPREPAYRALLGQSYLRAGRFDSAITALNDAMTLGDNSARTALALSLANIAAGRSGEAVAILDDWRDAIPPSDMGLALALAGETSRGVAILSDALRSGDASVKVRQNLAYAYALDGRWREARVMMAQDVPADQVDQRISTWASQGKSEDFKQRVASLLGVPLRSDPGQPSALALNNSPALEQLAAETAAVKDQPALAAAPAAEQPVVVAAAAPSELPPIDGMPVAAAEVAQPVAPVAVAAATTAAVQPAPARAFDQAFAAAEPAPAAAATNSIVYVSNPVIQAVPVRSAAAAPARSQAVPARVATAAPAAKPRVSPARIAINAPAAPRAAAARPAPRAGSHLVQLGSFSSAQGARRAWGYYAARNPALRGYRMTITPATVRGKNYWRVAAAGFDASSARGMCAAVKTRGGACFAYNGVRPAAPALARAAAKPGVRVAAAAPAQRGALVRSR